MWGARKKSGWGCFLDDLRAFGINANHWTTAALDEREWRKTAGQEGAEHFMAKLIAAEKNKSTASSGMPERVGKDQGRRG